VDSLLKGFIGLGEMGMSHEFGHKVVEAYGSRLFEELRRKAITVGHG
jgi:hypothetical protein